MKENREDTLNFQMCKRMSESGARVCACVCVFERDRDECDDIVDKKIHNTAS